jgi:DNA-binding HxlR family transcriptional regulator
VIETENLNPETSYWERPPAADGGGCPVQSIVDKLADKWKLQILLTLASEGVVRFRELQRQLHGVSPKVLTNALRELERDGLITRTHYPEIPPRVEYRAAERSRSLLPILAQLNEWATKHLV